MTPATHAECFHGFDPQLIAKGQCKRKHSSPGSPRILVMGLGCTRMGDDAVGHVIIRRLKSKYEFSDDVTLAELGTPDAGFGLYVACFDAMVIVDSVNATGRPGEIRRYKRTQLISPIPDRRFSPRDINLTEALREAESEGTAPVNIELIGVIPGNTELGGELSPPVGAGLHDLEIEVVDALRKLGATVHRNFNGAATNGRRG